MVEQLRLQKVTKLPDVKYIKNNRFELDKKHIDNLADSISKFGSNISPILLTNDNYILDGQNRVQAFEQTLQRGEDNSLYVVTIDKDYEGNEDFFKNILSEVNNKVAKWQMKDWLMHHIDNPNYKQLHDLWAEYPEHQLSSLRSLTVGTLSVGGGLSRAFCDGHFIYEMTDDKQRILDEVTTLIKEDLVVPGKVFAQSAVLRALVALNHDKNFDIDRMFAQIRKNMGTLHVQSGVANWSGYFKALFNKNLTPAKRIKRKFITSY